MGNNIPFSFNKKKKDKLLQDHPTLPISATITPAEFKPSSLDRIALLIPKLSATSTAKIIASLAATSSTTSADDYP